MPAVAKTSHEDVVQAARALVERVGVDGLSMQAVASEVGVRAPSLYKRFQDRTALLAAVQIDTLASLERTLERAATTGRPIDDLEAMGHAYRRFAKTRPRLYEILFARAPEDLATNRARAAAARPVLERVARLVGQEKSLASARVLTAFVHGFVSMENAGAFHLGPGIDEAFRRGLSMLLDGLRAESRRR